jgi:hypothetical protein
MPPDLDRGELDEPYETFWAIEYEIFFLISGSALAA